uniref:hypothetical protein n=1 Tax=Gluconobacter thailandicus TaxID=257438 RepID=UPI001E2F3A38
STNGSSIPPFSFRIAYEIKVGHFKLTFSTQSPQSCLFNQRAIESSSLTNVGRLSNIVRKIWAGPVG